MLEIPPAKDTDAEDVVWGLQTAETLWKRGERIDALVWLRRAAQAAGDANDDDRALELARHAAELTEWMANLASMPPGAMTSSAPPVEPQVDAEPPSEGEEENPPIRQNPFLANDGEANGPWATPEAEAIRPHAASQPTLVTTAPPHGDEEEYQTQEPEDLPPPQPPTPPPPPAVEEEGRPSATSVPPAEKVHAGMFDPWADQSSQMENVPPSKPHVPIAPPPPPVPKPPSHPPYVGDAQVDEEVVTSVRPHAMAEHLASARIEQPSSPGVAPPPRPSRPNITGGPAAGPTPPPKPPPPKPGKPPPLPPRARPPLPKPSSPSITTSTLAEPAAPPPPAPPTPPPPPPTPPPPAPQPEAAVPDIEPYVPPATELASVPAPAQQQQQQEEEEQQPLNLEGVEAFADLPDDARAEFAKAATLHSLAEGEEIGTFALAYIVDGEFDVAATVVDAPAVRLTTGAVLRARGTTEEGVPMRLICAQPRDKGNCTVATWSDAAVTAAFRTIPWVEEDLRAAADKVQTLVGITIGPLGERLDMSIRELIVSRLTMRPLGPSEIVVKAGEAVPGLLLVGIGELELVGADDKVAGVVGSGEFLFPTEVLGAGSAPATARAGSGGALVMFGDRGVAQELLVTCPPLLEVFAGM